MKKLLNPVKQKLNWTGWFKHVFKLKHGQRYVAPEVPRSSSETPELSNIEVRIGRTLRGYYSVDSDYIEMDEKDLMDYIDTLDVRIYSVYMNFEIELMTYRQLEVWLSIYCPKYSETILCHFEKFFVPHHIKRNVYEPSSVMLQLIDLATEREKLFKQAFEANPMFDSKTRILMYEDISKKEYEILKQYRMITYEIPKRVNKRTIKEPITQPSSEDIEI